jgi:hypothetical protein
MTLPKPGTDLKFPQNLCPISLLSTTGKLVETLKTIHRHTDERNLLNAGQFGFHQCHSTILQCMRLTDHTTLNFTNSMSMAAVFLDIKKATAHNMAPWPNIYIVRIKIFDKFDQTDCLGT